MMQGIVSQGDFMLIRNLTRNWTFSQTYGPVANQAHVSCLLGRDDGTDLMNFNLVSFDTCSAFDRLTGNTEGIGDCPSNPSLARDCSNWHFVMMQRPLPPNTIFPDIMATFFGPPDFGRVGVITNGEFDMVWRSPN